MILDFFFLILSLNIRWNEWKWRRQLSKHTNKESIKGKNEKNRWEDNGETWQLSSKLFYTRRATAKCLQQCIYKIQKTLHVVCSSCFLLCFWLSFSFSIKLLFPTMQLPFPVSFLATKYSLNLLRNSNQLKDQIISRQAAEEEE